MFKKRTKILTLILLMFFILCSCTSPQTDTSINSPQPTTVIPETSKFEAHFIDVGQADATLLFCDDKTMLIDGGNPDDSNVIAAYLKKHNVKHIDYLICSHAHDDHVGGLSGALSVATVGKVFAPKTENDIRSYKSFKKKLAEQHLEIKTPVCGDTFNFGISNVLFLGPVHENTDNLNNTSIILKITYGNTSFLFTGDAEHEEELTVIEQDIDLSADVLKVGHHGSAYSTTYLFLREIMPKYAIISVGKHNSYGHPSEQTLSRLNDADVDVYRTDIHGDIVVSSNGETITVQTDKSSSTSSNTIHTEENSVAPMQYIGNKNTKKFHYPECSSVNAMKESNKVFFTCTRDEIISEGFVACQRCNP